MARAKVTGWKNIRRSSPSCAVSEVSVLLHKKTRVGHIRLQSCLSSLRLEDRTFASPEIKEGFVATLTGRLPSFESVIYTVGSSDLKREYESVLSWVHSALLQLFEALRYKPEGRGFDSRWCH